MAVTEHERQVSPRRAPSEDKHQHAGLPERR